MLDTSKKRGKPLTVFTLVMMTVIAIDSLKNLPVNAQYGSSLIFFYLMATLLFFIPSALVAAELATAWPQTGGIYIWVREAFGKRLAFLAVWIQWLYQIIWYPTILSFIAVTAAYLISPTYAENKTFIFVTILSVFWFATFLNCKGLKLSSMVSTWSALIGVVIPMLFITALGAYWIYSGNAIQIHFSGETTLSNSFTIDNLRLFITLLFSLMGIELIAVHAGDVENPSSDYPRSIIISAIIILATVIPSSLAIAAVIPKKQIGLASGVIEAFTIFLNAFHLKWFTPVVVLAVAIGSFGIFFTWLLAAARCLLVAAQDGSLPSFLQRTNKKDMPITLLITQGVIFSLLSAAFIFMPTVSSAFWMLTVCSSQLALIYYIFLFACAIKLRFKNPHVKRPFKVGKNNFIIVSICSIAILTCLISIGFGFIPPPEATTSSLLTYEIFLSGLIITGSGAALLIYRICHKE